MISASDNLQLLVDLALKSIITMLAALCLIRLLNRASAALRHSTWTLSLCALLALPALTLLLPGWQAPLLPALAPPETSAHLSRPPESFTTVSTAEAATAPLPVAAPDSTTTAAAEPPAAPKLAGKPDGTLIALIVWLAGVVIVLARLAAGMFRVHRIVRRSQFVIDYHWGALVRRLAGQMQLPEHIALLNSEYVGMPQTWGVWNPVVLLPEEADEWPAEWRRIVLLHELAHIKRRDCLTQLLAQVVCAIYWFNPLVWVAARRLRVEREVACDDYVIEAGTRASDYASSLLELAGLLNLDGAPARLPSPAAAGIACSQLEYRVRSILDPAIRRRRLSLKARLLLIAGAACLFIPFAALQPWSRAASPLAAPEESSAALLPQDPLSNANAPAPPTRNKKDEDTLKGAPDDPDVAPQVKATAQGENEVQREDQEEQKDDGGPSTQERGSSKKERAGSEMTVETIIRLKQQGVTPEFVESMRRAGFPNLSSEELIKLRIHGISEEYIKETNKASKEKLSLDDLIQLKIFGVTPEYAREMKSAGYDLPLRSLKQMRMFGITPEYIAAMRKLGSSNLSAEQLTKLKMHGVSETYLKEMREAGITNLDVDELARLRMFGVDPAFIKEMRAAGYDKLSAEQLTKLRMHGVTPAFVKEMREVGFDKLTLEELIKLRIFGVTADYVREMRAAGLKKISFDDLIKLKMNGVDQIFLKSK